MTWDFFFTNLYYNESSLPPFITTNQMSSKSTDTFMGHLICGIKNMGIRGWNKDRKLMRIRIRYQILCLVCKGKMLDIDSLYTKTTLLNLFSSFFIKCKNVLSLLLTPPHTPPLRYKVGGIT